MATEEDKVNTGALATLVVVGTFAMVAICLALVGFVRDELSVVYQSKDQGASASYLTLENDQREKLEKGFSIQAAMADVVREIAADPTSATPPSKIAQGGSSSTPAPPSAGGLGAVSPAPPGQAGSGPSPAKDVKLPPPAAPAPPATPGPGVPTVTTSPEGAAPSPDGPRHAQ